MPNRSLSLAQGAIVPWMRATGEGSAWYSALLEGVAAKYGISLDVASARSVRRRRIDVILNGSRGKKVTVRYKSGSGRMRSYDVVYEGVIPNLQRRYEATSSDYVREELERYMAERPCPTCNGARLKPEVLGVTVDERSIVDVTRMPIREAQDWFAVLARDPGRGPERAADGARVPDRPPDPEGDPRTTRLPGRRRARLPDARAVRQHALRRRGAADPAGDADRLAA